MVVCILTLAGGLVSAPVASQLAVAGVVADELVTHFARVAGAVAKPQSLHLDARAGRRGELRAEAYCDEKSRIILPKRVL